MWFRRVKATGDSLNTALWVCHRGYGRSYKIWAGTGLLESRHLPFFEPHLPSGWGTGLQRGRQLFTFLHVSLTSLSSVQPLILFCVICYCCRRYRLDTDFDYVYGTEPLRTIVFKTPWRSSRSLLYNHSDMKWASRKPNPSFQTTFQFLSWLLLFCDSRYQ